MAAKVEKNIVQKLAFRQVRGCLKPARRGASSIRLFDTTYSRGCYIKLDKILDKEGEIKDGHVLLGFTKDGRFLISYTLVIDNDIHSPEPKHFYTLHWWKFDFNKPLVKVNSVSLFSSEGSNQELHIIISESPDRKQFIIWGRSSPDSTEQSCECHVTICPAIPTKPCLSCNELADMKCFEHSYVINFVYHCLPPYPIFLPSVSLQIPGTVLLNCGDHLIALKCAPCSVYSHVEKALKNYKVRPSIYPEMVAQEFESVEEHTTFLRRNNTWLDVVNIGNADSDSCSQFSESSVGNSEARLQGFTTFNKEKNESVTLNDTSVSQMEDCSPLNSELNKDKQIEDTEGNKTASLRNSALSISGACIESHCNSLKDVIDNGCLENDPKNSNMNGCNANVAGAYHDNENHDDDDAARHYSNTDASNQTNDNDSKFYIDGTDNVRNDGEAASHYSNSDSLNKDDDKDSKIDGTDNVHNDDANGCIIDSGTSASNDTNNNKNPTTFTFRTYCAHSETSIRQDDFDTHDCEISPLSITCNGEPVNTCSNVYHMTRPSILICQAFFSVEECINELLQSHHELHDRYKSLRDYDCQYISACPDTGDVIVMVKVLISAKRTRSCSSQGLPVSPNPSLYRTGFILAWNIWNGHYRTLRYMDVSDYTNTKHSTKSVSSIEASRTIRKETAIPTSYRSQVRVFSNHTVFSSQSLKYLIHPFLPIVLVM